MKSVAIPPSHTSGVCAPSPVEIDDKEHILNRAGSKMETYKGARTLTELKEFVTTTKGEAGNCLLYTSPSPRDGLLSRMPSSA